MTAEPKPNQRESYDGECSRKRLLSQPISKSFGTEKVDKRSAYQPKHNCPIVSFNGGPAQSPGDET